MRSGYFLPAAEIRMPAAVFLPECSMLPPATRWDVQKTLPGKSPRSQRDFAAPC